MKIENTPRRKKIFVGVTGASGCLYTEVLIRELLKRVDRIYLCASETAKQVVPYELKVPTNDKTFSLRRALSGKLTTEEKKIIRLFDSKDYFAPTASGSSLADHMIILPCSMGTLARVATGVSTSLLERSADVMLKQKRPLLICPRETPLNTIHLKNMLELSQMGAHIIPLMPGFYNKPETINDLVNFMVGRVLEALDLEHDLYTPWAAKRI